jgi:periplasmic protein TonB
MHRGLTVSAVVHAAVLALALFVTRTSSVPVPHAAAAEEAAPRRVWLSVPGPGGGGGGGGNRMNEPPRNAERPGRDALAVPVAPPARSTSEPSTREPDPAEQLTIPARNLAAAIDSLPGAIERPPGPPTLSQGSGSGGGAGTGQGHGVGSGTGSGLGAGAGGGTGGGIYREGNGVAGPRAVHIAKPGYTTDAMRARVQGSVLVECVVQISGVCTNARVLRSLDPIFGLDQEAVRAAGEWRFVPGMRLGQPVPVIVTIELDFVLR